MAGMEIFVDSSSDTRINLAEAERAQSRAAWNVPSVVSTHSQTHTGVSLR